MSAVADAGPAFHMQDRAPSLSMCSRTGQACRECARDAVDRRPAYGWRYSMSVTMQCRHCDSTYQLLDRMTPEELDQHAPDCPPQIYRASVAYHVIRPDPEYTADLIHASATSNYMQTLCRRLIDEQWALSPNERNHIAAEIAGELIRAAASVAEQQGLAS